MRSVFIHLRPAAEPEVAAFLQRAYPFQPGPPWILDEAGDAVLYIDIYRDMNTEFEVEDWLALIACLGGEPTASLVADISGRHAGDEQAHSFVCLLLTMFPGVAQDDYTTHCWSLEQIRNNAKIQGHAFFDYKGWASAEGR